MHLDFKISPEQFHREYLYQKPMVFKGAVKNINIGWKEINELYQRADPMDHQFKFRKGPMIPKEAYVEAVNDVGRTRYRFNKAAVYQYLKEGATLVYNRINNEPFVDDIAKQVAQFARAQTVVSSYLAFGDAPSYKNHWDTRDVFAVQLVGKKHWTLSAPNFAMPLYMQQAKDMPHILPPEKTDMEVVLEAGDVLYIPRGWWHNPVPLGCETFHLAIGTFPPNGYNYMEWLMKQMPEITSLRQSFRGWDADQENIRDIAQQVAGLIANPEQYEHFIQAFLGDQRVDSPLRMEYFGNPNADSLPDNVRLRLNAVDMSTLAKGYIIANGTKINVDEDSIEVLEKLACRNKVSLCDLLAGYTKEHQTKIEMLITQMGALDIIEIIETKGN
ncbi:cupin-like domain-containing protein [Uruburuella testudinis]|uniref:Cupin-like domain-containing protein n=1 Tax=Uruburuella testudinis TaxID=1282863 RepID=A0ABY4DWU8_9NEIS|nr:cupin domain-containing protein [Uruburuella testudinis]UOO83115.1 cupin-like domain-containing protein [Uruburuella testudinis]